jgi:fumarylacetoacetate (FAA) hydrolase
MKLLRFEYKGSYRIGLEHKGQVIDLRSVAESEGYEFPLTMEDFLMNLDEFEPMARDVDQRFREGEFESMELNYNELTIGAPLTKPESCRDAYAFRQHVEAARRNRGVDMIPEFDQFPIFYFTNHNSIVGPGDVELMADHFHKLDFELEIAAVVGRHGRNIPAQEADQYIFGYTIMNDFSARQLQMEEMKLNLGPAKGKDFANALGPLLVTRDELQPYLDRPYEGHVGENFELAMKAYVNGEQVSQGNFNTMFWSFAEILERVSYGVDIYPTEVIGSGTVGTGCFLEINGNRRREDPNAEPQWLREGDEITLEVQEMGRLTNRMVKSSDESLLAKKHQMHS